MAAAGKESLAEETCRPPREPVLDACFAAED